MVPNPLLYPEIQDFITNHIDSNISKLALQKNPFPNFDWVLILNQIEAKKKSINKLPTWFSTKNIIYPSKISVEQTSSEITAEHKSKIVSGENLIDLSGGFGVDDFYFSKKMNTVVHCEMDDQLSEIVKHNFEQLGVTNISCYNSDSLSILTKLKIKWDWIYIDPSRRNHDKGKVFMLKDCLPNVPENLELLFHYSKSILIKTAPLLDISAGLLELKQVKKIHVIAVDNEVKELLWELNKGYNNKITITTVNISKGKAVVFDFIKDNNTKVSKYSLPQKFLYEPNAAIMKSGGFDEIGLQYNLHKLHQHSHLYTNFTLITFPGRVFEIEFTFLYSKNEIKKHLEGKQLNITTRNFPETVENVKKKWKIKDGGNQYCFLTTDENNNRIVLICKKM